MLNIGIPIVYTVMISSIGRRRKCLVTDTFWLFQFYEIYKRVWDAEWVYWSYEKY